MDLLELSSILLLLAVVVHSVAAVERVDIEHLQHS
jgi:hypothetical protein